MENISQKKIRTYIRKREKHQVIEDVERLCRLCLEAAETSVPIFKEEDSYIATLALRIMICVGIDIQKREGLPNKICVRCYEELERYYKFRKNCEASHQRLKSHILAVNERNVKHDVSPVIKTPEQNVFLEEDKNAQLVDEGPKEDGDQKDEVQIIVHASDAPTTLPMFLKSILEELNILKYSQEGVEVNDQGFGGFELETGDSDVISFELEEEDDAVDNLIIEEDLRDETKTEPNEIMKNVTRCLWCDTCGKSFSKPGALTRHLATHSGTRPFACDICPRKFTQKAVRDRHRLVHQARRPFVCGECGASFTQRGALAGHARRHAPARPALRLHPCPHCDKMFLYPSGVSRHMFVHSGRQYACGVCARRFHDASSLARHARTAHHTHTHTQHHTRTPHSTPRPIATKKVTSHASPGLTSQD